MVGNFLVVCWILSRSIPHHLVLQKLGKKETMILAFRYIIL